MSVHFLKGLVFLIIVLLMTHGAFTQWYLVGYMRVFAPILVMGFAFCFVAFLLRKAWSWRLVASIVVVEIFINLVFWPEYRHFGDFLYFAKVLIGAKIALFHCSVVLCFTPIQRGGSVNVTPVN